MAGVSGSRFSVLTVSVLVLSAAVSMTAAEEKPAAACSPAFITKVVDFCAKEFGGVKKTGDPAQDAILNAVATFKCCGKAQDGVTTECGCAIRSALTAQRVGGNFVETGCLSRYNCPSQ